MADNRSISEPQGLLVSGGLDSSILLAHLLEQGHRVQPLYVATDCAWQQEEHKALLQFIEALDSEKMDQLVELQMPVSDLYRDHWSITGRGVPDKTTEDEAVFLWGRNPLLLIKSMLWCALHNIPELALATLACNPFTDATPQFFREFQQALTTATNTSVEILRPFAGMSKQEVLSLGANLPLHLTFSCLAPVDTLHCGVCNKCAERAQALRGMAGGDPTVYAIQMPTVELQL